MALWRKGYVLCAIRLRFATMAWPKVIVSAMLLFKLKMAFRSHSHEDLPTETSAFRLNAEPEHTLAAPIDTRQGIAAPLGRALDGPDRCGAARDSAGKVAFTSSGRHKVVQRPNRTPGRTIVSEGLRWEIRIRVAGSPLRGFLRNSDAIGKLAL